MRIHVLSDLHLEFGPLDIPRSPADVAVLAGDIHRGAQGIDWARRMFPRIPVIYVAGNHEFYGHEMKRTLEQLQEEAEKTDGHVNFLNNDCLVHEGIRFVASTLWSDFRLFGQAPETVAAAKEIAERRINDFRLIRWADGTDEQSFSVERSIVLHEKARSFLDRTLAHPLDSKTVVVTHHCPGWGSVHEQYRHDPLTPSFCSDLDHLMGRAIAWIHGHTHDSFDYLWHGTRVVCNPRGYHGVDLNRSFDARKLIEV